VEGVCECMCYEDEFSNFLATLVHSRQWFFFAEKLKGLANACGKDERQVVRS
jgi:hypothetical protein